MKHQYEQALDVITNTLSRIAELEAALAEAEVKLASHREPYERVATLTNSVIDDLQDQLVKTLANQATARAEGARDAIDHVSNAFFTSGRERRALQEFRDIHYPTPASGEGTRTDAPCSVTNNPSPAHVHGAHCHINCACGCGGFRPTPQAAPEPKSGDAGEVTDPVADVMARAQTIADQWYDRDRSHRLIEAADLRLLLSALSEARAENEELERGARGAIQVAAMMLVKLGGSATFTALEQTAVQGRVTRTDGPMGEYTLSLAALADGTTEGTTDAPCRDCDGHGVRYDRDGYPDGRCDCRTTPQPAPERVVRVMVVAEVDSYITITPDIARRIVSLADGTTEGK